MYSLKAETKRSIGESVGIPYERLITMDHEEVYRELNLPEDQKPVFRASADPRMQSRGNLYLALGRFRTIEEVDKQLEEICNGRDRKQKHGA
jgi:hypothetical protein